MVNTTFFNFYDYLKNPIAEFCAKQNSANILTLDDLYVYLDKLPYTQKMLEIDRKISVGNEFRLYLASISDEFFYQDLDCFIPNKIIEDIQTNGNCVAYHENKFIETGTFFHTYKNCKFINFYLEKYQEFVKNNNLSRFNIFNAYPFEMHDNYSGDMKLYKIDKNIKHFFLSNFKKFQNENPDTNIIYYTYEPLKKYNSTKNVWVFNTSKENHIRKFSNNTNFWHYDTCNYPYIDQGTLEDLFKAQMNYLYQKDMKYIEV